MKISPARTAAFDVLIKIETEKAFSSVLLAAFEENLSVRDRGLCHELVLGVLRRQIYLDKILDFFAGGKRLDAAVRVALRIGLYQVLFLDKVPHHSAINESVNLVQRAKKTSAKGFVNALLRRATREEIGLKVLSEIERVSVETSHPEWLLEKWSAEFGWDEAVRLGEANNEIPNAAFRFTGKFKRGDRGEGIRESDFVEGCFIAERVDGWLKSAADRGEIYFQDEASQMVAAAVRLNPGGGFLDVCAAPGSKTTMIANRLATLEGTLPNRRVSAFKFVAGDSYWSRVAFLKENCIRQGVGFVNIVQYDAEHSLPFAYEVFDSVLVDAPCTGTGTIRHNPEIRYFLRPEDFAELQGKQLRILKNASKLVTRGGTLIYSTCSLEKEENEDVCEAFLAENEEFGLVKPDLRDRFLTERGFARTYPQRDEMDGFFVAEFRRR
jgi:16S rRNA (cytosine967-C5)-methyltransferase